MIEEPELFEREDGNIRMKVVGVGGAGSNMVDRLMLSNPPGVHLTVLNTDQQALANSPVLDKHCIGASITGGLGAGGEWEVGREAALADKPLLEEICQDVDLLFVTAGLGGGTGTGVAPVLADVAAKSGALVISFVALPFTVERAKRSQIAQNGLEQLRDVCSAVIPLPNDLLIQESDSEASLLDAFGQADAWVEKAIKSIWSMMHKTGLINLDFSQLRQAFSQRAGKTLFGLGEGEGEKAVDEAIANLNLCPLLHTPEFSKEAERLLINIVGGPNLGLGDVKRIMNAITDEFGKEANVVMGSVIDDAIKDRIEICVIGTSDIRAGSPYLARRPSKTKSENTLKPAENKAEQKPPKIKKITHARSIKTQQDEFAFNNSDPKGEFENSVGAIFEGQDLDTPTYYRRGVKIPL